MCACHWFSRACLAARQSPFSAVSIWHDDVLPPACRVFMCLTDTCSRPAAVQQLLASWPNAAAAGDSAGSGGGRGRGTAAAAAPRQAAWRGGAVSAAAAAARPPALWWRLWRCARGRADLQQHHQGPRGRWQGFRVVDTFIGLLYLMHGRFGIARNMCL